MKALSSTIWQSLKSPRTILKCKLNYYAAGLLFIGVTFFSYGELKLFPQLVGSFFLDLLLLQFGYAGVCLLCGALLSPSGAAVKVVSVLTLLGLYAPMIICIIFLCKNIYLDNSFVLYSFCMSLIFLFLAIELMSFKKNFAV